MNASEWVTVDSIAVLEAARARIADPAHWTTKSLARNVHDLWAHPHSKDAVKWCATGALWAETEYGSREWEVGGAALVAAARALHGLAPSDVNDRLGHAAALALYDYALERERARAAAEGATA